MSEVQFVQPDRNREGRAVALATTRPCSFGTGLPEPQAALDFPEGFFEILIPPLEFANLLV